MPVRIDAQSLLDLMRDVHRKEGGRAAYLRSLEKLRQVKPDVWLPAIAVNGQNANLYDHDWADVLSANGELFP